MLRTKIEGHRLSTDQRVDAAIFVVEQSHVEYVISSSYEGATVRVQRRFSEFEQLHQGLAHTWCDTSGVPILPEVFPVSKLLFHCVGCHLFHPVDGLLSVEDWNDYRLATKALKELAPLPQLV
jgi:hypothetical protein